MPLDTVPARESFSSVEAARLAGVSYRQLDHWARKGLVEPSVAAAAGSGTQRRYSFADLVAVTTVRRLRDAGISLGRAAEHLDAIRRVLHQEPAATRLIIRGKEVCAVSDDDMVVNLARGGQLVMTLDLGDVAAAVEGVIAALPVRRGADKDGAAAAVNE